MKTLDDYRNRIDEIDDQLIELFRARMDAAFEIAKIKKEQNLPVLNTAREREIIVRMAEKVGDGLSMYAKVLYSTLFDLSRSYQTRYLSRKSSLTERIEQALLKEQRDFPQKAVVACQGVEGAYSQLACDQLFEFPSIMYFTSFEGVFQAVNSGMCRYGILPIENSSFGSVNEVYDLMSRYSFQIVRSIKLKLNHCLLGKKGTRLSEIREVFSHRQAIGQCSRFLKDMPGVKVTECENTAVAAQMVLKSERNDVAAISSRDCARLYGLQILSDEVQNSDHNYTRFICISRETELYSGANRISMMLTLPHRPGSLYRAIAKFSALGVNLTKLESRPITGSDFEFLFYFDMEASLHSEEVVRLLASFEEESEFFVFLGNYYES